jgi:fido (protein-threonine AMPylation protein)
MVKVIKEKGKAAIQELNERVTEFLTESNAIDIVTGINYAAEDLRQDGKGQFGALKDAIKLGMEQKPLTVEDLCRWQKWITTEQKEFGQEIKQEAIGKIRSSQLPVNVKSGDFSTVDFKEVPEKIKHFVDSLNKALKEFNMRERDSSLATMLGDFLYEFEAIHPFVTANGRTGRVLANFIASWFDAPCIVFRAAEKKEFFDAHRSKIAMRLFMAKKIQEAIFNEEGRLFPMLEHYGLSARYTNPGVKEVIIVEWHGLIHAIRKWKEEEKA